MKQGSGVEMKKLLIGVLAIVIFALGMVMTGLITNSSKMTSAKLGKTLENYDENNIEGNDEQESEEEVNGKVIIRYVDSNGVAIAENEEVEGKIGTEYQTSRKTIAHYKSNGTEPINKAGNYRSENITVTYVYELVSDSIDIQSQDNLITVKVENEHPNREYKLKLEQKSTDSALLTGGKFSLIDDKDNSKLVDGMTTNGALTLGVINVNDEVNEQYDLVEDQAPKGYLKALGDTNFTIQLIKTYNSETKEYELHVTSQDTRLEIVEDSQNDEITIKVVNEKKKTYELAAKQFVSSVDGTATNRNITASVNNEGNIVYNETEEDVAVRDFERVIYTIRIFNEGNQNMTAGIVTEELPAGLKFLTDSQINQDYGWTLSDGKLKTNHIQNTTIDGIDTATQTQIDYEELKLEVEVEEENAGEGNSLESKVSIAIDEREENQTNNEYTEISTLDRIPANYDLAVKKFASKINGTDTGRSVTASLNELNQIVYEENNEEQSIKNGETVVYTIRVYNEGNRDLNGTKVTEVLPDGLTLASNSEINEQYGWEVVEGKLQSTYLENKTIEKVRTYRGEIPQYEDIKVELLLNEENIEDGVTYIVNEAQIAKAAGETDELDNSDLDSIILDRAPQTYDFALKLFASEINGVETGRNVTASVTEEKQILYTETRPAKSAKNAQSIVYTIRVFNEGNGEITGTKLTDIIPTGLKFKEDSEINEEYGWTKNGNNAETTYLEDKTIQGVNLQRSEQPKFIDAKIELEVVEADVQEDQTQFINKVQIAKGQNETDEEDNEDQDTVNLAVAEKTYNLAIKKFASKIDNENTGRNVEVALTAQNEIVYTRTRVAKEVQEGQKITYTFRIFNEGNQNLQGTKITESLPAGLKFVENSEINEQYGWEVVEGNLETTYLEGKTINGVRIEEGQLPNHEDVLLELEVTREGLEDTSTPIENTVNLSKHDLETNVEDNQDKDTITLGELPKHNLAVSKFVSKIDGGSTRREVTITKNTNGEFVFTKPSTREKVKNKQKVTYKYRVFNTGNVVIQGTALEETIPQGLRYLEDSQTNQAYGWTKQDDKLTTQYLVGKTINTYDSGVNYKDVEIEFEVVEDEVREDNLIVNTIKVAKNDEETDTTDNEDTQIVELQRSEKIYDVIMKKFVYSLDGDTLDKEITARVTDTGRILFKNDNTKTSVNKGQTVVFTLRMFNIGNQPMTGNVVTDTIPEGLEYIENSEINRQYNWNVQNSIATTNYLEGQTIEGFDIDNSETPKYVEVKIECRVTAQGNKAEDSIINTAKMEESPNDQNPENNEDTTELLLEPEEQEVSDLSMKKFVYSVDGKKVKNREIEAVNKNGTILYTSNEKIFEASNNQKIVYTLRVYNLGNGKAQGREVIENLPAGLEFIKDSEINIQNGWKMYKKDDSGKLVETDKLEEATTIKTDKLKTKTIPGFKAENNETPKYKDVKIEVLVKEDKVKNEDRIIKNVAKVSKLRTEPNSNNDKAEEKLKVKKFDLNVTKYIKEIMVADKDGEVVTAVGIDKRDQIIKKEIHKKKLNETELYVTYGLKVKNVGEIAGYAKEITDYIPANFQLVGQDYGWKVNGNVVTTEVLANQLIKPNDYKTIEVTFRWKLSDGELGLRNNKAIISKYKNDYDAKDNTPDENNESKIIVSIKTGEDQVIAGIILAILMIIASAICIKLNKQNKK